MARHPIEEVEILATHSLRQLSRLLSPTLWPCDRGFRLLQFSCNPARKKKSIHYRHALTVPRSLSARRSSHPKALLYESLFPPGIEASRRKKSPIAIHKENASEAQLSPILTRPTDATSILIS